MPSVDHHRGTVDGPNHSIAARCHLLKLHSEALHLELESTTFDIDRDFGSSHWIFTFLKRDGAAIEVGSVMGLPLYVKITRPSGALVEPQSELA